MSAEWKKTEFYKMGRVSVTIELLQDLLPYIQEKRENVFIADTGVSVANVLANYITKTGGDIYCNA